MLLKPGVTEYVLSSIFSNFHAGDCGWPLILRALSAASTSSFNSSSDCLFNSGDLPAVAIDFLIVIACCVTFQH